MARAVLTFLLTLTVALFFVSCSRGKEAPKEAAKTPPEHGKAVEAYKKSLDDSKKSIAASVNGVNITMFDLVQEMNEIGLKHVKPGEERNPKADEKVLKESLDRLIYRELAVQEAMKQGMQPLPGPVDEEIKKIKAALKTEEAFRNKLANSGITEEDLKKQIGRNMLVAMITEKEIFDKVKVDPKLIKKTYESKKSSYKRPSGEVMSFEEARPVIEEKLMIPLVQKREDEWTAELKKKAKVEIQDNEALKKIHSIYGARPDTKQP